MKPYCKEVEILIKIFQQAEYELVREIYRQQTNGFVDYHTTAQLHKVQKILKDMKAKSFKFIPKMVKEQFYMGKKMSAKWGYKNAEAIISNIGLKEIEELIRQMETRIIAMALTAESEITNLVQNAIILGRQNDDIFRKVGLMGVIKSKATGGVTSARKYIIDELKNHGITGFVDKAGKRWRLSAYANMVARTTARQSSNLGSIDIPGQDLYKMSKHSGACPICVPLQGRVYSKSGTNPNYPPLAWAFGKIDKSGPDTLDNSWLNIHPNCLHVLIPFNEKGKSDLELQKIRDFSSFEKNPPNVENAQAKEEYDAYKQKMQGERKFRQAEQQWNRWVAKGFNTKFMTFLKHKIANDLKYKQWKELYSGR